MQAWQRLSCNRDAKLMLTNKKSTPDYSGCHSRTKPRNPFALWKPKGGSSPISFGGANGARTRHLIHAMDALSQMSYCPIHKKILQYIKKIINQKLHLNKQRCSLNFIKINEFDLLKVNHLKHVVFLNFQYFVNLILF